MGTLRGAAERRPARTISGNLVSRVTSMVRELPGVGGRSGRRRQQAPPAAVVRPLRPRKAPQRDGSAGAARGRGTRPTTSSPRPTAPCQPRRRPAGVHAKEPERRRTAGRRALRGVEAVRVAMTLLVPVISAWRPRSSGASGTPRAGGGAGRLQSRDGGNGATPAQRQDTRLARCGPGRTRKEPRRHERATSFDQIPRHRRRRRAAAPAVAFCCRSTGGGEFRALVTAASRSTISCASS